jgi:uridine kinase
MNQPIILFITGASGTGKTTLGRALATHFRLPLLYRDGLKE